MNISNINNIAGKKFGRLTVKSYLKKGHDVFWVCDCDCGKEHTAYASNIKSGATKSCGCLNKEISGARFKKLNKWQKGENHPTYHKYGKDNPTYKGGHVSERTEIKRRIEYKEWRKAVFNRDYYTCQACSEKGCYLNAHHIKRFSDYPELRFDINNGITLCVECHKKTLRKEHLCENLFNLTLEATEFLKELRSMYGKTNPKILFI